VFGAACESGEDDSVLNLWFLGLGNPDIVPCVTSGGSALFLDLPANIVGSFLMGLFLGSTKLDRAMIDVPVPILPRSNRIQFRPDIQIGIRTGLCGSLTTFSGWNTQMVLLMVGANRDLRIYDAIFGYIIGLSAAMSSFVAGKHLAMAVFCWVNGDGMSKEMEEMAANPAMSIVVNQQLCDFERRFMLDILTDQDYKQVAEFLSSNVIEDLKQWKSSTDADRWALHGTNYLHSKLKNVESTVLVHKNSLSENLVFIANERGWNVNSLIDYTKKKNSITIETDSDRKESTRKNVQQLLSNHTTSILLKKVENGTTNFRLVITICIFCLVYGILLYGIFALHDLRLLRIVCLSSILSPFGAIIRWILSRYNGFLSGSWHWFPLGTFITNMLASVISMMAYSLELGYDVGEEISGIDEASILLLSAIKVGLAGCLSTVSTFVAETNGLLSSPYKMPAYLYSFGSLVAAGVLGIVIYFAI